MDVFGVRLKVVVLLLDVVVGVGVGVLVDGVDCEARAYYTTDKDDAFATFAAMTEEAK